MKPFIDAAMAACQEIQTLVLHNDVSLFTAHTSGFGGDISRGVDLQAESICHRHLSPIGSVFSEESGWMGEKSSITIVLDPIDGSDNFISAFPYYGVSLCRLQNGTATDAIVCNLVNGDVFVRTPDEYYKCTLKTPYVKLPVLVNPFAKIGLFEKAAEHPALIKILMENKLKFRSPGALALSLAYAPYVKYMLFLGTMRPYDIQAGLYLSQHLYFIQDERYILISADKEVFEQIRSIVEKEYF
ncbi:MAG: inositol monophosphatase family protein [Sulfuricurvum sp.]|uniref:inositol monophosphatase family protein n=1 Tax=Sulfuricurvum sp. TaxID=2025608 RepID=UPI003D124C31